jgi:hypothetical protein
VWPARTAAQAMPGPLSPYLSQGPLSSHSSGLLPFLLDKHVWKIAWDFVCLRSELGALGD